MGAGARPGYRWRMAMKRKGAPGRGRTKEAREITAKVEAAGGTVERTGKGRLKITGPKSGLVLDING